MQLVWSARSSRVVVRGVVVVAVQVPEKYRVVFPLIIELFEIYYISRSVFF